MRLYFVRHGKAEQAAESDHARELTTKGAARVRVLAGALAHMGVTPDYVYASPRVRAQQTAQIMADMLGATVETRDAVNFSFSLEAVETLTSDLSPDSDVMFVGHNPSMSQVVQDICGAQVSMKTGAVACVETGSSSRYGMLQWYVYPKMFEKLD